MAVLLATLFPDIVTKVDIATRDNQEYSCYADVGNLTHLHKLDYFVVRNVFFIFGWVAYYYKVAKDD